MRCARQPALAGVKLLNRLENVLARREWNDGGVHEGLMRDTAGLVISGTMSNVFIVEAGALLTPALVHCGVAGVTRARIFAIAPFLQVACVEEEITLERALGASELFFVNSVIGLWRVARLGGKSWTESEVSSRVAAGLQADHG
jgi:4-amino-4-deoxychorismate lyase